MVNPKHAFWQALVSAILIFGIGLLIGAFIEDSRSRDIEQTLINSEINSLDQQLIQQINNNFDIDCRIAEKNLVEFADNIYNEARLLEKYDSSSELTNTLKILHRKYDLLRTMLWIQSINLKKACNSEFHTLVYIYQYNNPAINTASTQTAFSRLLTDIKEKYGNEVILIPIAGDLNLTSLDLIKESYSISSYPVIILDERELINDIEELSKIESYLEKFSSNETESSAIPSYPLNSYFMQNLEPGYIGMPSI